MVTAWRDCTPAYSDIPSHIPLPSDSDTSFLRTETSPGARIPLFLYTILDIRLTSLDAGIAHIL